MISTMYRSKQNTMDPPKVSRCRQRLLDRRMAHHKRAIQPVMDTFAFLTPCGFLCVHELCKLRMVSMDCNRMLSSTEAWPLNIHIRVYPQHQDRCDFLNIPVAPPMRIHVLITELARQYLEMQWFSSDGFEYLSGNASKIVLIDNDSRNHHLNIPGFNITDFCKCRTRARKRYIECYKLTNSFHADYQWPYYPQPDWG